MKLNKNKTPKLGAGGGGGNQAEMRMPTGVSLLPTSCAKYSDRLSSNTQERHTKYLKHFQCVTEGQTN